MIGLNRSRILASRRRAACFFAHFVLLGLLTTSGPAQTFTPLHSFTVLFNPIYTNGVEVTAGTNSDGATPIAGLLLSGRTLYGSTIQGGSWGLGTVFKINTDGTSFTTLHSFTAESGPGNTNSDGAGPGGG